MAVVLVLVGLFGALGLGLALNVSIDRLLGANHREHAALRLAAEAGLELALHDLGPYEGWAEVPGGPLTSRLTDGPPTGTRRLDSGEAIDLGRLTAVATCGAPSCRDRDIAARTADRPWGAANPRWRLFAWGRASAMAPARWPGDPYVVVWIADDPSDADGNPWRDAPAGVTGHGHLLLRAQALGRGGARATVEALVRHGCAALPSIACAERIHVQSWRLVP